MVSDSTVVRFAALVGYPGFPEMRQTLQSTLVSRMAPVELLQTRMRADAEGSALRLEVENVRSLDGTLTSAILEPAIKLLLDARQIFVFGLRSGFGVAHTCWHLIHQALGNAQLVTLTGGSMPDQITQIERGDLLVVFSTSRYSRQILEVATYASQQGAKVMAITDTLVAPVARVASLTIPVRTDGTSFFPSMVAAHAVIDVIVSEMTRRQRRSTSQRLARLEKVADEFRLFLEGGRSRSRPRLNTSRPESARRRFRRTIA
jgi:DNA-binding MurR/RpiR family transcriptional regulator